MPLIASAIWEQMSLEQLVDRSDLIVVGEIVAGDGNSSGPYELGTIKVSEVLAGASSKGLSAVLLAMRQRGGLVASDSIVYRAGQSGIWFLRKAPGEGYYLADHPQRRMPESMLEQVRKTISTRKTGG
jgi:hypothetical protein